MDDFHGVSNDPDGHELLTVVSAVHHERVGEPLDDGALGLPETLHRVPPGSVGDIGGVFRRFNSDVIVQGDVIDLKIEYKLVQAFFQTDCVHK